MKKIVIVALLAAAAGCGGKKSGSDCEAAITKGIENTLKVIKESVPNPQVVAGNQAMMDKVKGVLIERCKADGWPPEVVSCFTTVSGVKDMQSCQGKLTREQASKLMGDLSRVTLGAAGLRMGEGMPPGMPGHPEKLMANPGSGASAGAAPAPGAAAGSSDTSSAPGTPPAPSGAVAPAGESSGSGAK